MACTPEGGAAVPDDPSNNVASDALLVTIAEYPAAGGWLRPLPGAARDRNRVRKWLAAHAPGTIMKEVCWPPIDGQPCKHPVYSYDIDSEMRSFRLAASQRRRGRLFGFFSSHGCSTVDNPAMPVIYCASHSRVVPDMFTSAGWIRLLVALPLYKEYLFFFDCCNDWQPGPLPPWFMPNVAYREDKPSVLVGAACAPNQEAVESANGGVFTDVLLEALSGSAGSTGSDVTARDVVDYLKERVPTRAAALKPDHVQTPLFWFDTQMHTDLASFSLFQRSQVTADVSGIISGRAAADVEVLNVNLEPIGTLAAAAGGAAVFEAFPGKYVLRSRVDDWRRVIMLRTTVNEEGAVRPLVDEAT